MNSSGTGHLAMLISNSLNGPRIKIVGNSEHHSGQRLYAKGLKIACIFISGLIQCYLVVLLSACVRITYENCLIFFDNVPNLVYIKMKINKTHLLIFWPGAFFRKFSTRCKDLDK